MAVCCSHCLLPFCQLTLTSPLARGDILSFSAIVCLCGDFLFGSCADGREEQAPPLRLCLSQPFVCASIYRLHRVLIDGRPMVAPTVKLSICALKLSFYQTVAFAAGGASPSPTGKPSICALEFRID